jgi:hypothetical protein
MPANTPLSGEWNLSDIFAPAEPGSSTQPAAQAPGGDPFSGIAKAVLVAGIDAAKASLDKAPLTPDKSSGTDVVAQKDSSKYDYRSIGTIALVIIAAVFAAKFLFKK